MNRKILSVVSALGAVVLAHQAHADVTNFAFNGPGVSGQGTLTYTLQADGSGIISGITGAFTDTNAGINGKPSMTDVAITGLVPIDPVVPLPPAVIAPDFSLFAIANGVPATLTTPASTSLSYDNVYYPNGSPVVCTDYPFSGGQFDVYGLLFTLSNGDVVGLWSNGIQPGPPDPAIYGVAVADSTYTYDYVSGGVTLAVPEPTALGVMVLSIAGFGVARRRKVKG